MGSGILWCEAGINPSSNWSAMGELGFSYGLPPGNQNQWLRGFYDE
jgi:hypothetical protein